ncbi:MAG TPA: phosphotransferase [Blastocatellia bacterium]|nr:phosphotransferase [Blastocatellia bacterium]HMV83382.1 phosphotransferase [Blastocatellia bacterium]HMX24247.1 phosphotransferase [Blastocatellia bacterium]HMY70358.1 phosphotransferase [Blastocatellia bacterium]HMZ18556.1 phosphotransferase [Blastocatellia bacterium]
MIANSLDDFSAPVMQSGATAKATGGLSEKRVVSYAARYFGIAVEDVRFQTLTPDASTRKYYRIATAQASQATLIVSLYPSPFNPLDNSFLDVTKLFEQAGLPVPKIIDAAGTEGIILQEDLGDVSLAKWLSDAEAKGDAAGAQQMLHRSIEFIAQIQAATALAYTMDSVAGRLAFDEDKLSWELNYFFDHFFGSYRQHKFTAEEEDAIKRDLREIAVELAARPRALTHRDYHAMNLMVDARGELRIIDHQDARMGPVTYDLVPLLVERRLQPVDEAWIEEQQGLFLRLHEKACSPKLKPEDLRYEFHLMTIQRQLKAMGTFSYQTAVVGRGVVYEKYIVPAAATVLRAMSKPGMKEYPALRRALESI